MPKGLSPRVLKTISRRDHDAEIRISLAQLAIVLFFSALYWGVPRAEGGGDFNVIPYALMAYGTFTVIRLILAQRRLLTPVLLVLSIAADVTFLIGLIYSFHIQYGEPASFSLKAPSILYIFIFIALRAMRFDATYVVLTGAGFLLGWTGLLVYAVFLDPDFPGVTRNYVDYVNGMKILIGAELDKMISIAAVTGLLAYASVNARSLLARAVQDEAAVLSLSRFFSPEVAASLKGSEKELTAGMGMACQVSVLTVDIRGFTSLSAGLSPPDVIKVLTAYQKHVVGAIGAYGGQIDKFLGDGILATFADEDEDDTHAARSMRAMEAIIATVPELSRDLEAEGLPGDIALGVSVCSGAVIMGIIGSPDRLEHTVIGNAVNTVAKLEDLNKSLGTYAVCTREHFDMAAAQGYATNSTSEPIPNVAVPGIDAPLDLVGFKDTAPLIGQDQASDTVVPIREIRPSEPVEHPPQARPRKTPRKG